MSEERYLRSHRSKRKQHVFVKKMQILEENTKNALNLEHVFLMEKNKNRFCRFKQTSPFRKEIYWREMIT